MAPFNLKLEPRGAGEPVPTGGCADPEGDCFRDEPVTLPGVILDPKEYVDGPNPYIFDSMIRLINRRDPIGLQNQKKKTLRGERSLVKWLKEAGWRILRWPMLVAKEDPAI